MRRLFLVSLVLISGLFFTCSLTSVFEPQVALATPTSTKALTSDDFLHSQFSILNSSCFILNSAEDRGISRRATSINGRLEGSLQQLTPETVTLNGGATITEKLYVPGTPTVWRNGNPNFGGVSEGSGSAIPTSYQVTPNGNATLGNLVNRTNPVALTPVATPPTPTGTRDVSLNNPNDQIGDFATLRNLTLNGNAGTRSVPPGTYGNFTVNGSSVLIFGVANATEPAVYNLQGLTLNGGTQLQIVGPVTLTLRNGTNINGTIGNAANPQWLTLNVSNGGVTLNGGSQMFGKVNAPAGSVTVNSRLTGNVICDRLTVNGSRVVTILAQAPQDTTAPVITIAEPVQGLITKTSPVRVSGTVTDASAVTVTINGQPVTLSGTQFSTSVTLAEGSNTITVLATDTFGNVGTASRNVTLDTTAPVLNITSPQDGAVTTEAQILITGEIADATSTLVKVNNQLTLLTGNTFNITVPLTEGVNPLSIVAIDGAENTTIKVLQIERDSKNPALQVTSPEELSFITEVAQVTFSGTVIDETTTTVYVNGEIAPLNGTTFELTFPLREGRNKITVGAVDEAENISEMTFTITRQTIIPLTLTVKSPIDGDITRSPEIMIVGDVTGTGTVQVTANGIPIQVTPYGEVISKQFEISEGSNSLHIVAVDALNNRVEVVRTVFKDSVPPVISDLSPPNRAIITTPTITLEGNVADATGVTVEVNEVEATVSEGHFRATNIPVAEGENILRITATDEAGNSVSEIIRLTGKDQSPPSQPTIFPITSPTRLVFQRIKGQAEPNSTVAISNGVTSITTKAIPSTGLFFAQVELSVRVNTFSVTATDSNGNVSSVKQVAITCDPNLPLSAAGQPAQVHSATGNTQRGLVRTELPQPLTTFITDREGNPVANVEVTYQVVYGGGKLIGGDNTFTVTRNTQGVVFRNSRRAGQVDPIFVGQAGL